MYLQWVVMCEFTHVYVCLVSRVAGRLLQQQWGRPTRAWWSGFGLEHEIQEDHTGVCLPLSGTQTLSIKLLFPPRIRHKQECHKHKHTEISQVACRYISFHHLCLSVFLHSSCILWLHPAGIHTLTHSHTHIHKGTVHNKHLSSFIHSSLTFSSEHKVFVMNLHGALTYADVIQHWI